MNFLKQVSHRSPKTRTEIFLVLIAAVLTACTGTHKNPLETAQGDSTWNRWVSEHRNQLKDGSVVELRVGSRDCRKGKDFKVEVAASDASRTQGLGDRPKPLDEKSGMLFVFESERPLNFWMMRTLIPLGIIYFDESGKSIRSLEMTVEENPNEPKRTYPSVSPALLALEVSPEALRSLGGGIKSLCWRPLNGNSP